MLMHLTAPFAPVRYPSEDATLSFEKAMSTKAQLFPGSNIVLPDKLVHVATAFFGYMALKQLMPSLDDAAVTNTVLLAGLGNEIYEGLNPAYDYDFSGYDLEANLTGVLLARSLYQNKSFEEKLKHAEVSLLENLNNFTTKAITNKPKNYNISTFQKPCFLCGSRDSNPDNHLGRVVSCH